MRVNDYLELAAFENLSSDPSSGVIGRFIWNTTDNQLKSDDGSNFRNLLRNDAYAVLGNAGTASENIRLHRGAAGVLQFVEGDDSTVEGTLSTNINQISARMENYTDAGKPANGNAGRIIFVTDLNTPLVDDGTAWNPLGGGGGGGALEWVEDAEAPVPEIENNQQVYAFQSGEDQKLYAMIRVPDSYNAGRQIRLKIGYYTADTSNTALLQTVATLLRNGTDAIDSVANQRTSTNSAVSLSGAANLTRTVEFDLTDSSGEINSVAVNPGDYIKVQLTRGTDTATSDIKALVYGAEVLLT